MKIEIFTAGCKICGDVESQVTAIAGDKHEVMVYNLNDESKPVDYYEAAKNYGLNSLPSVVVNGKLLSCCSRKRFDQDILLQALL